MTRPINETPYEGIGGRDTLVRVLGRVFRERLPQDEKTRDTVWPLFVRLHENEPMLEAHVQKVAQALGKLLGGPGPDVSLQTLANWHGGVGPAGNRLTGEQFDLTLGVIVEELHNEGNGVGETVLEAAGPAVPAIRSAIVDGIVPTQP